MFNAVLIGARSNKYCAVSLLLFWCIGNNNSAETASSQRMFAAHWCSSPLFILVECYGIVLLLRTGCVGVLVNFFRQQASFFFFFYESQHSAVQLARSLTNSGYLEGFEFAAGRSCAAEQSAAVCHHLVSQTALLILLLLITEEVKARGRWSSCCLGGS